MPPEQKSRNKVMLTPQQKAKIQREKLTGPLLYGAAAFATLQSSPQSRQSFRQYRTSGFTTTSIPATNDKGKSYSKTSKCVDKPILPLKTKLFSLKNNFEFETPPPKAVKNSISSKKEKKEKETFAEFQRRINTLTANNYDLDPNLHESFLDLSLGQRAKNSAFDFGPDITSSDTSTKAPKQKQLNLEKQKEEQERIDAKYMKPFETIFAASERRSSGSESDTFKPSQRYWRNNLLKQKHRDAKKEHHYTSSVQNPGLPLSARRKYYPGTLRLGEYSTASKVKYGAFRSSTLEDGEDILRHAARLLNESAKLRQKKENKVPPSPKPKEINYVPLKMKGLKRNPKTTFHDRIQERRENIKNNGYKFVEADNSSIEIEGIVSGRNLGETSNRGSFEGKKLSSLIAKNVAATQGRQFNLTAADDMNPIEKKMVAGLEGLELSYFLNGPGQRSPKPKMLPRPILKKDENRQFRLCTGQGLTSLIESIESEYPPSKRPFSYESKITKYLDELRISGYPDLPTKSSPRIRNRYGRSPPNGDFQLDDSVLDNLNLSSARKRNIMAVLKEKRLQQIRTKAGGGMNWTNNPYIPIITGSTPEY